jgi:hypothetical protein
MTNSQAKEAMRAAAYADRITGSVTNFTRLCEKLNVGSWPVAPDRHFTMIWL